MPTGKLTRVPADRIPLKITVQERVYRVDDVVVLSERENVSEVIENAPSFVTVVERSDFENDAVSVADVLMDVPGTTINVMGGLGDYSEVSLRGAYSNQVQVYVEIVNLFEFCRISRNSRLGKMLEHQARRCF